MEKEFNVTPEKAKEVYADLRGYRRKDSPKCLAVLWYWDNKPEVREAFSNYLKGFLRLMEICHVFWSSRGDETAKDLEREDREQTYTLV